MQGGGFRLLRSSGKVLQFGKSRSPLTEILRTQAGYTGFRPWSPFWPEVISSHRRQCRGAGGCVCVCVPELASVNVPVPQRLCVWCRVRCGA